MTDVTEGQLLIGLTLLYVIAWAIGDLYDRTSDYLFWRLFK